MRVVSADGVGSPLELELQVVGIVDIGAGTSGCGCWEWISGPLEKQHMLLTTASSLQPPKCVSQTGLKIVILLILHPSCKGGNRNE